MNNGSTHFLPFEALLTQLSQQGFVIGPDVYIRIQQLLNAQADQEPLPVHRLRYQLGALIARSEPELKRYYSLFDAFVEAHTFVAPATNKQEKPLIQQRRNLQYLWALIPVLILGLWYLLRPKPTTTCSDLAHATRIQTSTVSEYHGQTIKFEYYFDNTQKKLPPIREGQWDFGDGETQLTERDEWLTQHYYSNPGTYYPELVLRMGDSCEVRLRDTVVVKPNIRLEAPILIPRTRR